MSDQKLIVILGATGVQGGSVVETFLADPSWRIRALTRNASSPKAQSLAARSPRIEVSSTDTNDATSLRAVFDGAHAIFAVTDFWTLYLDPSNKDKPEPGQPLNEWCSEMELQQGRNIFDAASRIPTLKRLVFSSLSNVSKWSGGKYTHVLHFDSKALATEYGQETYPDLWSKTSIVQVGMYLSNLLAPSFLRPSMSSEGVLTFNCARRMREPFPFVAAEKDTGTITKLLVEQPAGRNVIAYREEMTIPEYAQLWGKTLGIRTKIEYGPTPVPEGLEKELDEMWAYTDEFGFWGYEDKSVIRPKDLVPGLELGTVEEWIKAQDWSPLLTQ